VIYLDTHVVAWLYAAEVKRFTALGRQRLETEELLVSPIVELELQYLREVERITTDAAPIMEALRTLIGLAMCEQAFAVVVAESIRQTWTRDPFDRLIVAQAITRNAPLLTKDQTILEHYPLAFW
jgi:PIN domain nuclease of toxin-antitoxin system